MDEKWVYPLTDLHVDRHRVGPALVLHDGRHQRGHGKTDGPGSVALQLDDLVGAGGQEQWLGILPKMKKKLGRKSYLKKKN